MTLPAEADARSEKAWVIQRNRCTSDTIQRHIVIWYDGGLISHDRQEHISTDFPQQLISTHPLESTSSVWQSDAIGGPTPDRLAPGVKYLHQFMSSVRSLASIRIHRYYQMVRSIPSTLFPTLVSARKCEYHFSNLLSDDIFCAFLNPSRVWNRRYEASKLPSMFADHTWKWESQDPWMIGSSFNEWSADSSHIHSEGERGHENPWEWSATVDMREEMKDFWVRMSPAWWTAVTLWQSYLLWARLCPVIPKVLACTLSSW